MNSPTRLLDTNIIVDILRGYPPAFAWFTSLGNAVVGLPGFVVLELIQGCKSKQQIAKLKKVISKLPVYWPTAGQCEQAAVYFENSYLSSNLGAFDALIGACAVGLGVPLCTFNVKHFKAIPGLVIEEPY